MTMGLTPRQAELLRFIKRHIAEHGYAPTFEVMREALGLHSKSGVARLIEGLEERGAIRRLRGAPRAIEVLSTDPSFDPDLAERVNDAAIQETKAKFEARFRELALIRLVAECGEYAPRRVQKRVLKALEQFWDPETREQIDTMERLLALRNPQGRS